MELERRPRAEVEKPAVGETDPLAPTPAEVVDEVVELGRIAAATWWRGVGRVAEVGVIRPARAAAALVGEAAIPAGTLLGEAVRPASAVIEEAIRPAAVPVAIAGGAPPTSRSGLRGSLRERGAELLRRSADVGYEHDQHPAYRRILDELAPDEARILRLLATEGPQPLVEVRAGLPPGTRAVRSGLSMIAVDAGCRYVERDRQYLDNLARLGLAAVATDSVSDPMRYQLLEAQPEVIAALAEAGRTGRTARHSVDLTTFGRDFCAACLPLGQPRPDDS